MKRIIRYTTILLLIASGFQACSSKEKEEKSNKLTFELMDADFEQAVLYSIKGSKKTAVDTAYSDKSEFVFSNIDQYPGGLYRVFFHDTIYTELIFNNEDIHVKVSANNLLESMEVIESVENELLFNYWKKALSIRNDIKVLNVKRQMEMKKGNAANSQLINSYNRKINNMNIKLGEYTDSLLKEHQETFAAVLLKSYQMPSYQKHKQEKGEDALPEEKAFYLFHYFDNIDFSDKRLVNTNVLYVSINDYIKTFANPPSTKIYNDIINRISEKAQANKEVYRYVQSLFLENFEYSIWDKVSINILKNIISSDYYSDKEKNIYKTKLEILKSLQFGEKPANIEMPNTKGVGVNLHNLDAEVKLVLFWSSDCKQCDKVVPDMMEVYNDYKERGFEVYAVGIEDGNSEWLKKIEEYNLNWINVSDLMGQQSDVIWKYHVWKTPSMYLLDSENKIIGKPRNAEDVYARLIQEGL